ncbi:OBAP family protein [Spirosoma agri]|uniref:OBAP family protein n=1 Tax=Spirosoma agri TaxID=1987381 RepID=A0A6M0IBP6_9BACT|nr:OBAP family protein [Spirosoma agri]NEU65478.1 OBAP family protein [Spirosoma agri]
MMGFIQDSQLHTSLEQTRDRHFNVPSADKKKNRASIPAPQSQPGADAWQTGSVTQLPALMKRKQH